MSRTSGATSSAPSSGRHCRLAIAALFVGLAAAGPATAAVSDKVKKACKGDYQRLCPGYKIGSPQLRACMEAKQSEISSRCVDALVDSGEVDKERVANRRR